MSVEQFWVSVNAAARMVNPAVTADSAQINEGYIERVLRKSALWLTPGSVAGFDPDDFSFLAPEEREELRELVRRFREVADQVDQHGQATPEQIQAALPIFSRIVQIVGSNRFADPSALRYGKIIDQRVRRRLPNSVVELRYETGEDSHGGRALWIWVVLDDDANLDEPRLLEVMKTVRQLLVQAVGESGIELWPFVRFRSQSDLEPLPVDQDAI